MVYLYNKLKLFKNIYYVIENFYKMIMDGILVQVFKYFLADIFINKYEKKFFISYRDLVLIWFFKDSFGGNFWIIMIVSEFLL